MGRGSKKQTVGYRYYMSLLMGIGRGPVDEIVQIRAGGMNAWPVAEGTPARTVLSIPVPLPVQERAVLTVAEGPNGLGVAQFNDGTSLVVPLDQVLTARENGVTRINASEIFGGEKKEGGIDGPLRVMMGAANQIVPPYIKTLIGGRVPDYRGVTTMFFDGLIAMLNPYPKAWKVRVRRTTSGWDGPVWQPSLATIWMRNGTIKAMNPMHIIYECLTNRDWGRGYPRAWLNDTKMAEIAQVLYNENFGMCLRWSRSGELGEFIQMVIDHIGGSLYVDRSNGLISMDLLRGDYDVAALPLFAYNTGLLSVEEADTASQDDIVNEVIVEWNDPIQDKSRQVRVHNLASLQSMGGGKNSTKTEYAGVPVAGLAARLAQRDLKVGATSLKRFKVVLDRRAWRMKPGDVFRISAPDKDVYNVVLRAGKVNSGTNLDGKITVEAVLDVFGLPASSFVAQPGVEWSPPSRVPQPVTRSMAREANYRDLVLTMGPGDLQTVTDDAATVATMAAKPTDLSQAYNLSTRVAGEDFRTQGSGTFLPSAIVSNAIDFADATVRFSDGQDMGLVVSGIAVQVGDEIMSLTDIDPLTNTLSVGRGCADTTPRSHAAGTPIFFMTDDPGTDAREYVMGESVDVKILPYTSAAQLPVAQAATNVVPIVARQGRPWPPGNVRVNGTRLTGAGGGSAAAGDTIVLTWAHRDRKIIQDQLLPHGSGSVGPEPGTTYRIRVYRTAGATSPIRTVTGITAATWTYTNAMASADGVSDSVWFELEAVRGGMASFQRYRFNVSASFVPVPVDELVVQVSNPGASQFADNAFTRIPFYTESLDVQNAFSSNDRYTVPSAGTYRFVLDVVWEGASIPLLPGSTWDLKIDNFTGPTTEMITGQSTSGLGSSPGSLTCDITLPAGAVVSAYLRHNNGGNITVASAVLSIVRLA